MTLIIFAIIAALLLAGAELWALAIADQGDSDKQYEYHGWWPWDGKNVADYNSREGIRD